MGATAFPDISTDDPYAALDVVGAMKKIKSLGPPGDLLYMANDSTGDGVDCDVHSTACVCADGA